ncbi:MAG: 2'-5' RNA ligase family protein [Candidatus Yanofskybacteria bacterium]|nr:2'-5' RNA ligase family protein [Candidatus Yanofskybacteria bacterium]
MRYFIGYLIEGAAGAWHRELARRLSELFGTRKPYEKVPPHITLVPPFDTDDIERVEVVVGELLRQRKSPDAFRMTGFDRFGERVAFVDIRVEEAAYRVVEDLRTRIRGVVASASGEPAYPWRPHATLADQMTPEVMASVWEYLQHVQKPSFSLPFTVVTLFRKTDGVWVPEKSFPFGA